jgi:hypothetical protein
MGSADRLAGEGAQSLGKTGGTHDVMPHGERQDGNSQGPPIFDVDAGDSRWIKPVDRVEICRLLPASKVGWSWFGTSGSDDPVFPFEPPMIVYLSFASL